MVVANALGTGVLESAAWLGFHPGVSERLLGEALILPSVATWWCGEEPALEYVLAHLNDLVIKPTYPNQHLSRSLAARWWGLRARRWSRACAPGPTPM
ncbi:MAG: circularly permuted type 2 ATP-grasp protein [Steroidobacteraceae bacterium]